LAALPECVHLIVNLLGVERRQLLPQLFQTNGGLDVGDQVEHLYLCRSESYCFHNRTFLHFPLQRYDNYPTFALTKAIFYSKESGSWGVFP